MTSDHDDFSKEYNDKSFWQKVADFAVNAGKDVLEKALTLYFCLIDSDTPSWAKGVIVSALGYFIVPVDAIPDLTPAVGFSDDLGALASAMAIVAAHIKPEHKANAQEKLEVWFG